VVAAISAVVWGVLFFGIIDLTVPIDATPGFYESYLLETGWGVTYTFLVAAAFVSLAVRPTLAAPLIQVALVALCLAVTAVASGSLIQLVPAALLVLNVLGISRLVRGPLRPAQGWYRPPLDPVLAVLAALLAAPAVVFAAQMVAGYRTGRAPTNEDTWDVDHWPTQAAMALAVVAVAAAVAAGVRGRWSGSGVSAGCAAATAGWFGVASYSYPGLAGGVDRWWGVAVIAWAVAFVVATGVRAAVYRRVASETQRSENAEDPA